MGVEKYDLSDCSIVIPVHIDSPERLEHIYFLHYFFNQHFSKHQLIIIEQGKKPQIHLASSPNIHIEFIKSENGFSSSEISNRGVLLVKSPFFCKYDADAIIHPKAIFDAFEHLKTNPNQSIVLPYNGLSFSIQDNLRKKILQTKDVQLLPFIKPEEIENKLPQDIHLKCQSSSGLIHHFNTSIFKELGGYNEEFIGWGYEDTEIINRFNTLGKPKIILENYNAFHLDHPRKEGDPAQIFKNYCRKQISQAMTPQELRHSIKTWNRFSS